MITGFGRLGHMFGADAFDLKPDMMTLAKEFTSGYQSLSALIIRDEVNEVIARKSAEFCVLGHGYTYTAHPVPVAVALETLKIYEEIDIVSLVRRRAQTFWSALDPVRASPIVGELRGMGLMAGIELCADRPSKLKFNADVAAARVFESHCLDRGLIARAIGDSLAIAPPLIISDDEIHILASRLIDALHATEATLRH